jgi:hypothetical protein
LSVADCQNCARPVSSSLRHRDNEPRHVAGDSLARHLLSLDQAVRRQGKESMSYDILKNLGLDRVDTSSPDFLKTLERMQREAWQSLQREYQGLQDHGHADDIVE